MRTFTSPILRVRVVPCPKSRPAGPVVERLDDGRFPRADSEFIFLEIAGRASAARWPLGPEAMRGPARKRNAAAIDGVGRLFRRPNLLPGGNNSTVGHGRIPFLWSTGRCPPRPASWFFPILPQVENTRLTHLGYPATMNADRRQERMGTETRGRPCPRPAPSSADRPWSRHRWAAVRTCIHRHETRWAEVSLRQQDRS